MEDGVMRAEGMVVVAAGARTVGIVARHPLSVFDLPGTPPTEQLVTTLREHLFGTASRAIRPA